MDVLGARKKGRRERREVEDLALFGRREVLLFPLRPPWDRRGTAELFFMSVRVPTGERKEGKKGGANVASSSTRIRARLGLPPPTATNRMAPKSSTGQQSISSFFRPSQSQPPPSSKRPASTEIISLLSSSDDESLPPSRAPKPAAPLPKRLKLESSAPSVPQPIASTSAATSSTSSVPIDRWRFDPSAASEASQSGVVGRGGERREQFREKLLGRTVGRKSGYLQNEHYLAARADGDGGSEGEMQVADEDAYGEEEVMHGKGKGKQEEPASQFAKFAAKGAMSGGAKGKGKEKEATKGIKYTPLEQQVLALKKANPGVLLMIEVRRSCEGTLPQVLMPALSRSATSSSSTTRTPWCVSSLVVGWREADVSGRRLRVDCLGSLIFPLST